MFEKLLNGTSVNKKLFEAVLNNDLKAIKSSIQQGANVNYAGDKNFTPLHIAARNGNLEIVHFLLNCNAKLDSLAHYTFFGRTEPKRSNTTPLHFAAQSGHPEIVKLLLEKKADVNIKNGDKDTPLHIAAGHGKNQVVDLLIEHKADVNARTKEDWTPLHITARNNYIGVCEQLLKNGALINPKDYQGWIPFDYAEKTGQVEAAAFLKEYAEIKTLKISNPEVQPFKIESEKKEISILPPKINIATSPSSVISSLQKIEWESLQLEKLIGNGSYGEVHKGKWFNIDVAIKHLYIKVLSTDLNKNFDQETSFMAQCAFPFIVRLYGICREEGHYALVMEYLPKGSLYQVLHDDKELLPWNPIRWKIALDISTGLAYLHKKNIIHCDLKSLNILLDNNYLAKITDFGLSTIKQEIVTTSTKSYKGMGTTRWRAPELFKRKAISNEKSDIYSCGMVFWEIATRKIPFQDAVDDVMAAVWIQNGEKEEIPKDCPTEYTRLLEQCWSLPENRPSAQALVSALTLIQAKPDIPELSKTEPYAEKSWHFDPETKAKRPDKDKIYELVEATDKDKYKVTQFYQHHPVPGYDLAQVHVIYNPDMNYKFSLYLKELQQRYNNSAFKPKWPSGQESMHSPMESSEQIAWRGEIYQQCLNLAQPYQDSDYPAVNLLPMWHGTQKMIVDSIFKTGYANLATTDAGYFGKGIYGAYEAEYSWRVYAKGGALILNWTACFSPYPVMDGDMTKLESKGNYSNYDAHFIPVVPRNPDNPDETVYYPTKPKELHQYTELVVFQSAACLPRYLVELQPSLPKPVAPITITTGDYNGAFFLPKNKQIDSSSKNKNEEKNSYVFK